MSPGYRHFEGAFVCSGEENDFTSLLGNVTLAFQTVTICLTDFTAIVHMGCAELFILERK